MPFRVYNIGSNNPQDLKAYIEILEENWEELEKILLPLQQGDVPDTEADVNDLIQEFGYKPQTSIEEGIGKFVDWYLSYYEEKTK